MTRYNLEKIKLAIEAKRNIYEDTSIAGELTLDWENWEAYFKEGSNAKKRVRKPYCERNYKVFDNQLGVKLTQNRQTGTYHLDCYFDLDGSNDWQKLQSIMKEVYREIRRPTPHPSPVSLR